MVLNNELDMEYPKAFEDWFQKEMSGSYSDDEKYCMYFGWEAAMEHVKALCKGKVKEAWDTNRDEYGRAQANALQNFSDEL